MSSRREMDGSGSRLRRWASVDRAFPSYAQAARGIRSCILSFSLLSHRGADHLEPGRISVSINKEYNYYRRDAGSTIVYGGLWLA